MKIDVGHSDGGLSLEFFQQSDRYAHRVAALKCRNDGPMISSNEDAPESHWPISPPCQQVSLEDRASAETVALVVGMAGRSHWSLSITPDSAAKALDFDVACRANRPPDWLGSSYRVVGNCQQCDDGSLRILRGGQSMMLCVSEEDAVSIRCADDQQSFAFVKTIESVQLPATFRWRYRIQWHG